jgi:histidyl-tRNA synthetase
MVEDKGLAPASADKIGTFVQRKGSPRALSEELRRDGLFAGHAKAEAALLELDKLWDYLDAMGSLK